MNLELKHLAAYPLGKNGLKVLITDEFKKNLNEAFGYHIKEDLSQKFYISNIDYESETICIITESGFGIDSIPLNSIVLLILPLSYLTKEIEHNGEKFVPLEFIIRMIEPEYILIDKSTFNFNVINKSIGLDQVFQLRYKTDFDDYKNVVMLNFHQKEKCFWHSERIIPITCIEKLYEWHFDIYGLIEQGLAIDINTL